MIVAIDPGITTGYCILSHGSIVEAGDLAPSGLRALRSIAESAQIRTSSLELEVVMETAIFPTNSKLANRLVEINLTIREMFKKYEITFISPGEWKNSPVRKTPMPAGRLKSQHQKDAYRLGIYFGTIYRMKTGRR